MKGLRTSEIGFQLSETNTYVSVGQYWERWRLPFSSLLGAEFFSIYLEDLSMSSGESQDITFLFLLKT